MRRAFLLLMLTAASLKAELKTVDERLAEFGEIVRQRLAPQLEQAGVPYPPQRVTFLGFKQERLLEVYGANAKGEFRFVCAYPILAASGQLGPKLREGDQQVPEGVYRVRELNPNSDYHLSIWLNYPNEFDLARAAEENRTEPGSEIMIHGGAASRGCLAVGDPAAEDLFVLAALIGIENVTVVLAPVDFRNAQAPLARSDTPLWTGGLYEQIRRELALYPRHAR